jgi:hypothetical protein
VLPHVLPPLICAREAHGCVSGVGARVRRWAVKKMGTCTHQCPRTRCAPLRCSLESA